MILHLMGIEEGHLLLDGSKDTGITRMQSYDEMSSVVVLFHQRALFVKSHVSRRANHGPGFVALRQCLGHQ